MTTLDERFKAANRPVRVTLSVPAATLLRLENLAAQIEITVQEAFEEAVGDWVVRRERCGNRKDRLALQQALRDAKDQAPVRKLLDRFRAQMERSMGEHKDSLKPLTEPAGSVSNEGMSTDSEGERTLRERREALGLSREKLARLADISTAAVAQFEEGRRPKRSKALPILEKTLADQERVAA